MPAFKDYIMYAVIETGGKQHKVEKGMILSVDLLKDEVGKKITFDNVLLYVDGEKVEVGQPYLSNVKVIAEIKDTVKSEKISILRFRRRKNSMRKIGHRAKHSQIEIKNIKLESK
ncbi:MAG: 50S ribosomal protein L21 [Gammaproteobacteria bacterium]